MNLRNTRLVTAAGSRRSADFRMRAIVILCAVRRVPARHRMPRACGQRVGKMLTPLVSLTHLL